MNKIKKKYILLYRSDYNYVMEEFDKIEDAIDYLSSMGGSGDYYIIEGKNIQLDKGKVK